jgi:hypothetical protein
MRQVEHYWLFAATCLAIAIVLLRLILRQRITLQSSLSYLAFLVLLAGVSLVPGVTSWLAQQMGFQLPSNFFFALAIAALAVLHLLALMTISRVELRSITLTQELGLLQEKLDRVLKMNEAQATGERAQRT